MTSAERLAFEKNVLAESEAQMRSMEELFKFEFRGAELSGEYPETVITIRYLDSRYDRLRNKAYRLWSSLVDDEGNVEAPPDQAATLITTWAVGG